jgi:hypothetical protein
MRKGLLFGVVVVMFSSCLKKQDFPNRPDLELIGVFSNPAALNANDSLGFVKFNFTDGDGDLGLSAGDTLGQFAPDEQYYYNLFIHYFEKRNGVYEEFVTPLPLHVRFKRLEAVGGSGALEGEMDVRYFSRPGSPYDTIRYEMYIVDRALQHSDTIITPDIILPF